MSYNDGGCCGGSGFSMPFAFTMPWGNNGNGSGWGNSNDMFGMLMMLLFFSLFGFGGNGYGNRGGMPMPFMGCCGGAGGNIAAEAAAYVGAQTTADKVSSIATGVDAVAGIATANGVKIETVKDQNAAGFAGLNTHLCEGFNNVAQQFNAQTMQGMNMHNATTALLNDMRAEQAKCCCENKSMMQAIASQQQYQAATDKCEILRAIADSEARIAARMDAAEKAALQEKLAKANAIIATQKAEADNAKQTAQLMSAIQAQCGQPRACAPATYSPCAPYGRGCEDPVCTLVNSLVTRWANAQEIPAVPAAAA